MLWTSKSAVGPCAQTHSSPWKSCISGTVRLLALHLAVLSKNLCASWLWGTKLNGFPGRVNNNSKNIWAGLNSSFRPRICFSLTLQMDHQNFLEGTMPGPHQFLLNLSYLATCGSRQGETCLYWVISSFFENIQNKSKRPKTLKSKSRLHDVSCLLSMWHPVCHT